MNAFLEISTQTLALANQQMGWGGNCSKGARRDVTLLCRGGAASPVRLI
jgi:hypothetical protein